MSFAPPLFVALIERLAAAHTANVERRMSVQVQQLADIVRRAKTAIATAGDSATRLQGSAERVVARVAEVEAMNLALNDAEAELAAALGTQSNGAPPLSDTPAPSPVSSVAASPHDAVAASLTQVATANGAA